MRAFKFQIPLAGWLFIIPEIILLAYQLFGLFSNGRKNWLPMVLLWALLLFNVWSDWTIDLFRQVLINLLVLLPMILLLFFPFRLRRLETYGKDLLNGFDDPVQPFVRNCHKYGLSVREIQVVDLVRKGYKNKRIAEELFISERTVDAHMQHIYEKVGERGRVALVNKLNE